MKKIQVITIANAFELVHRVVLPYNSLLELSRIDERHFGQKAAFWHTRYGWPDIVVCTASPSEVILDSTYGNRSRPHFVQPTRATSSICLDLQSDLTAREQFLSLLNPERAIFLAPYVHTDRVEQLADFLRSRGYTLVDFRYQAALVRRLWDKVSAENLVFRSVDHLSRHRPRSIAATSEIELLDAIARFARLGVERVVVKSASAVGGAGTFFVDCRDLRSSSSVQDLLVDTGQNEGDRSFPFLLEEWISWDVSPTVDIEVNGSRGVDLIGIGLQRLFDRRYYTGFYSSPQLKERWWYAGVENLARIVGSKLAHLGFSGPANLDFVVSASDRRITLIELNPRRSALIDGFSLQKLKCGARQDASISVADYVNVSSAFGSLDDAIASCNREEESVTIVPVADGGLASTFRWIGILATSSPQMASEEVLDEAVRQIQDPERDEIGVTGEKARSFTRISESAA
jgi:hypothetical protein